MFERYLPYAKLACLLLGALVVYQLFKFATAPDPLASPGMLVEADFSTVGRDADRGSGTDLPPAVRERVEQITASGILGPVPQPPPMALLGIGGGDVLLRTPNGQTGLLREGEALGGVKLLRIGINRVLVEYEGELQELLMFSGLGGETLMPNSISNQSTP
jgi:hypothetical protein